MQYIPSGGVLSYSLLFLTIIKREEKRDGAESGGVSPKSVRVRKSGGSKNKKKFDVEFFLGGGGRQDGRTPRTPLFYLIENALN
jgi:hypothetical protein